MWELRGWSGWKLAVFPCLEVLVFFSFPSSGFVRSGSIPPGVLFSFPSSFSNLAFALSSLGFLLLLFLSFLSFEPPTTLASGFQG